MTRATPPPDRHPRPRRRTVGVVVGLVLALGATAGGCATTVETSGGSGSSVPTTGTAMPGTTVRVDTTAPPATTRTTGTTPPTTCVRGPATTTPFDRGGGAITCSTVPGNPDDGSSSSPPMTDTTIPDVGPPVGPPPIEPDATHGLVRVTATGGYDCAGEACPAIGIIMAGQVELGPRLDPSDPRDLASRTARLDLTGTALVLALPGRYEVTATTDVGSCQPEVVTVVAGQTVEVPLRCAVPHR